MPVLIFSSPAIAWRDTENFEETCLEKTLLSKLSMGMPRCTPAQAEGQESNKQQARVKDIAMGDNTYTR